MMEGCVEAKKNLQTLPPKEQIYTKETIKNLSNGLLQIYEPELKNAKEKLKELTDKQDDLINRLTAEYNKLYICQFDCEIRITVATIKMYKDKLLHIKKDMLSLLEKVADLKERALRLQQQKSDELRKKTLQLKKEQELIGRKTAESLSSSSRN